jgi:CDP-diacylglycerol--serine O-phosphatidyltransferase
VKKGIYLIPNIVTLCGLTCGFYSILASLRGFSAIDLGNQDQGTMYFARAAWAILIANIFDSLDGWVARLTNTASRFGVQLDSLSDLLAFSTATAILCYSWQLHYVGRTGKIGWTIALFFVMCGALRLARFNIQSDTVESRSFTGMPTPGAATILASCALVCLDAQELMFPGFQYLLAFLTALLGVLMVSNVRYRSAKEFLMKKRKPFWVLALAAAVVILICIDPPIVIFACSLLYMLWGLAEAGYHYVTRRRVSKPPEGAINPRA